ncbi:MAG: acetate kinase [Haloplasmataceae bacterium]|jgi:acetate kinase|nr:acetate kinase [Haloplasmataceae bacterium]
MSKVLSVNAGSSSLKFKLFDMSNEVILTEGIVERIGSDEAMFTIKVKQEKIKKIMAIKNYELAVSLLINSLTHHEIIYDLDEIKGIGHRVVHGGETFKGSVIINDDVIKQIGDLNDLAPLHNPVNLMGIKQFMSLLPNIPNVAVFDTSFHQTMTEDAYLYGVPYEWYELYGVRKYGFHGTSHKYVSTRVRQILNKDDAKIIICHLGNGASVCAVHGEKSIDTTMGFTPLAGLLMGTRCGDVDAAIIPYVMTKANKTLNEIEADLNKKSGLLGVSGLSNDSRDIEDGINGGNKRCRLAQDIFIRRIVSYISSYHVLLDGADAIAFTAGIGENSTRVREEVLSKLSVLGIKIDHEANKVRGSEQLISTSDSSVKCFIIPTNEEVIIARDVVKLIIKN